MENDQFALGRSLNIRRKALGKIPVPYPFGFLILEGYYHKTIVLLRITIVKGKLRDMLQFSELSTYPLILLSNDRPGGNQSINFGHQTDCLI